jgi:plasmid stabilization system protein ParE
MMPRLLLEPEAEAEFLEAARWYEDRRPGLGTEFRASVATTLDVIEGTPERFPVALRDIRKARVPRFPYVVYYVSLSHVISVIAIIHGRRNPRRWQSRR